MGDVDYSFADETVLVTGASSGIGREIALSFAGAGATVLNVDRREAPLSDRLETPTHELITDRGGEAEYIDADIADEEDVERVRRRIASMGGVDVLVNNAAVYNVALLSEASPDRFEQMLSVNVVGLFRMTQMVTRTMEQNEIEGSVINLCSISSFLAQPGQSQYDATKGAVKMLTRNSALELASEGIRVNGIAPGQIDKSATPSKDIAEDERLVKQVPLKRAGTPKDVADGVLFLASDAANYISGEILHVDGGWQVL